MAEDKNLNNNDLNAADEFANAPQEQQPVEYTDDNIRHLSDMSMCVPVRVCTSVVWVTVICRKTESTCSSRRW